LKHILIAAALVVVSSLAHATYCPDGSLIASHPNGDCSKTNTPPPSPSSKSKSISDADASAKAGAWSGSKSSAKVGDVTAKGGAGGNASAAGGAGGNAAGGTGTGGSNSLGSVGNDNSSSSFRAYAISLPSPVFTPPMPMTCPGAEITQSARSVGWGFVSWADGHTDPRDCTLITLHNDMIQQCQFASAAELKAQLVRKYLPDFRDSNTIYLDLNPNECAMLRSPPAPVAAAPVIFTSVAAAPAACVAVRKAHPRKIVPSCK
jgi:hypothetical protein